MLGRLGGQEKTVMISCFAVAISVTVILLLVHVTDGQQCCVWKELGSISTASEVLDAPSSAPTASCSDPYAWTPCPTQSSCVTLYCAATFMTFTDAAFVASCQFTISDVLSVLRSYDVNAACTQSPGIYVGPGVHSTSTPAFDLISFTSTRLSATATSLETPASAFNISQNIATSNPTIAAPVMFSDVASPSKLRSWLGPDIFFQNPPPTPRFSHGFTSVEGKLYVFGGDNAADDG